MSERYGCERRPSQNRPRRLPIRTNLFYALLGNGLLNAARFGVVAILAKWTTPQIVGTYHFAAAVLAAPVTLLFGLELRAAFVADVRGEFAFGPYRALRQAGMLAAAPVLLGLVVASTADAPNPGLLWMMLAVCAARMAFQVAEVEWGAYQRHERLDRWCLSNVLRSVALLTPFAVVVPLVASRAANGEPALALAAALAAGASAIGLLLVWRLVDVRYVRRSPDLDLRWRGRDLLPLLRRTFPLGLVMLLITLCDAVPPWLIKRSTGQLTEVGYYGALRVITLAAGFFIVQLGNAAANRLATAYQSGSASFGRLAGRLMLVTAGVGLTLLAGAWLLGRPFLRMLYREEYAAYFPEFLILVGAQAILLLGNLLGFVVTSMRRFWVQVPIHLTVLTATTVAGWLWIPSDPVRGGAATQMVRAVVQTSLFLICLLWAAQQKPPPTEWAAPDRMRDEML